MEDSGGICSCSWVGSPNGTIPLSKTAVELVAGEAAVPLSAKPALRLLPHPSIVFSFSGSYAGGPWDSPIGPPFILMPQGVKLPLALAEWSIGTGKISGTLIFPQGSCTVLLTSERLQSVKFAVLNFPLFFGGQDRAMESEGGLRRVYRWLAGPWQIELTQAPGLEAIQKTLENKGGHAVTYTGTLTRPDGEMFDVKDAEKPLEVLWLFLSFARGGFCSVPLRAGMDANSDKICEQWRNQPVDRWLGKPSGIMSWFDTRHGEILPQVFSGFWNCLDNSKWEDAMRTALYWYLRSNEGGRSPGVDGGLILGQAALERLSHVTEGNSGRAHERIRRALIQDRMRIPTEVPPSCQGLTAFVPECRRKLKAKGKSEGEVDGPRTLTEIRNDLVHPKQKYKEPPYFEAWNLSQHYIELMLLRLCGYKGQYANRLKLGRQQGVVEPVPWP